MESERLCYLEFLVKSLNKCAGGHEWQCGAQCICGTRCPAHEGRVDTSLPNEERCCVQLGSDGDGEFLATS